MLTSQHVYTFKNKRRLKVETSNECKRLISTRYPTLSCLERQVPREIGKCNGAFAGGETIGGWRLKHRNGHWLHLAQLHRYTFGEVTRQAKQLQTLNLRTRACSSESLLSPYLSQSRHTLQSQAVLTSTVASRCSLDSKSTDPFGCLWLFPPNSTTTHRSDS